MLTALGSLNRGFISSSPVGNGSMALKPEATFAHLYPPYATVGIVVVVVQYCVLIDFFFQLNTI